MQPKKTKYRKYYKPRVLPKASSQTQNLGPFSSLNLVALESAYLNGRQIEAARQGIRRKLKRRGRLKILMLPDIGISNKSSGARMGKGKGKVSHWVGALASGRTIFQLTGISLKEGIPALQCGANKLPLKLKICQQ